MSPHCLDHFSTQRFRNLPRHLTPGPQLDRLGASAPKRVDKGWGYELWVVNKDYCGKLLHFERGRRCSWHYHRLKDEVFYLHAGRLLVRFGHGDDPAAAQSVVLLPAMSFEVPPGLRHRMEAEEKSDLFEFSTHHDEGDSIRLVRGD